MSSKTNKIARSVSWAGKATMFVLLTCLLVSSVLAGAAGVISVKAQPALQAEARERPQKMVSIIVQKANDSDEAEQLVSELGGTITKDLRLINAFGANLSAASARRLAASPAVSWVSLDAPVVSTAKPGENDPGSDDSQISTYLDTLNVRPVWEMGYDGSGIGVVVVDSGVTKEADFGRRVKSQISLSSSSNTVNDTYGHGTHVAGIAGGAGSMSGGLYQGIAPGINLYSVKINDETGMALESDVIAGLQWVLDHKDRHNLRVVNLSINETVEQSYHASPLNAAVEILWFNGIVVVVSAGNSGTDSSFNSISAAPANDPFVITVGASYEQGTADRADDSIATFSASGTTWDGFTKPEIIAPGKDIISVLSGQSGWDLEHPERVVAGDYFRISGTSMSAPMVAGAAALMLQANPQLTPDQVKYRLMHTAGAIQDSASGMSYPYLDVYQAVTDTSTESANTGTAASMLLWTGSEQVAWDSVSWNSVSWNSVSWNSVSWNSVSWNSVSWNSVSWNN